MSKKSNLFLRQLGFLLILLALSIVLWASEEPKDIIGKVKFDFPQSKSQSFPGVDYGIHRNGLLWTTIHNNGIIGNVFGFAIEDLHKSAPSFYHPRYSRKRHGYLASIWVGGIVGGDSLVSVGYGTEPGPYDWPLIEFWPDASPFGDLEVRSNQPSSPYYDPRALAGLEFHSAYTDTFQGEWFVTENEFDRRRHRPMGIKIEQSSYSWSENYAADFIMFDYKIKNIGLDTIRDAWVGLYYSGCIHFTGEVPGPPSDDIAGYMYSAPYEFEELGNEPMQTAYILDADGLSFSLPWDMIRTTNAFAITPLQLPDVAAINNFNWWINFYYGSTFNWGPRRAPSVENPLKLFQGELGQPRSDPDKYYMMANPEIDYSGYEMAVDHSRKGWLPPPEYAGNYARGNYPQILTSFGPFDLFPGEMHPLTLVLTIGEEVHYNSAAFYQMFDTLNPYPFMNQLDWSDLLTNIRWAKLIYDNPGVDTDLDGDSGRYVFRLEPFTGETTKVYFEGDGVPDFRGAQAPPPPEIRVIPSDGKIKIRWNGYLTETYYDPLSFIRDFEGYRVYISRSPLVSDASLLISWDQENYNWYRYERLRHDYKIVSIPKTIEELRSMFGEDFQPLMYNRQNPLEWDGEQYIFDMVDYNISDLTAPDGIHKLYPDAILDTSDVDEQGRLRYFEYEFVVEDLLPTIPYYVSVTAFDFGHPPKSLEPLESSVVANQVEVYAIGQESVEVSDLNVFVYPNPYRINADYSIRGFENRGDETSAERARRIYFANLPSQCTISIYSLDGDLIKRIEHNEPEGSGTRAVHEWDMITRNVQMITTGLYYWVVESGSKTQIGKFVLIK